MDSSVFPGCVLKVRLIGVIEADQKDNDEGWTRNDRLLAAAVHSRTHEDVKSLKDLRGHLLEEIKVFFVDYNKLHGKKFKPKGDHGEHKALGLVEAGSAQFRKHARAKK